MGSKNSKKKDDSPTPHLDGAKISLNDIYINIKIPSLFSNLEKVEKIIKEERHLNPELRRHASLVKIWTEFRGFMYPLEQEIAPFCAEEWEFENRVHEGLVCSHIVSVIITTFIDREFKLLDLHDKSVLLFACMFHDIAKRGPPEIDTKDPLHPFTSASKTLRILNRLGWIAHPEKVEETIQYIDSSCFYKKWAHFMDNRRLPGIYQRLLYVTGVVNDSNSKFSTYSEICKGLSKERLYSFEIIALVLLHQSVNFNEKVPNFTPLSEKEIRMFLTPRLLKLLGLLHKGDEGSYWLPHRIQDWEYLQGNESATRRYLDLLDSRE